MIIKIGPINFEVVYTKNLFDDNKKLDGNIQYSRCTIEIEENSSVQHQRQVLWHEIIHGILTQAGVDLGKQTETVCDAVAYGIMDVLDDNPDFR